MNILYLHGLDGEPNKEKINYLRSLGHIVLSPQLYYRENNKVFNLIEDLIKMENIDLIIGNSLGGFLGYHLSLKYNIDSILINPALNFQSVEQIIDSYTYCKEVKKIDIVLGEKDDIIKPLDTIKYISNNFKNSINYFFINAGHSLNLEEFKNSINYILL
jgi:hypothetical protein